MYQYEYICNKKSQNSFRNIEEYFNLEIQWIILYF